MAKTRTTLWRRPSLPAPRRPCLHLHLSGSSVSSLPPSHLGATAMGMLYQTMVCTACCTVCNAPCRTSLSNDLVYKTTMFVIFPSGISYDRLHEINPGLNCYKDGYNFDLYMKWFGNRICVATGIETCTQTYQACPGVGWCGHAWLTFSRSVSKHNRYLMNGTFCLTGSPST